LSGRAPAQGFNGGADVAGRTWTSARSGSFLSCPWPCAPPPPARRWRVSDARPPTCRGRGGSLAIW